MEPQTDNKGEYAEVERAALAATTKHAENGCCHNDAWRWRFCEYHLGMRDGVGVALMALRGELDNGG